MAIIFSLFFLPPFPFNNLPRRLVYIYYKDNCFELFRTIISLLGVIQNSWGKFQKVVQPTVSKTFGIADYIGLYISIYSINIQGVVL